MLLLRRALAILLAGLGSYYVIVGSVTVMTLPSVTNRWIALSGDPDFKFDFGLFAMLIAMGAVMVAWLGIATVLRGVNTALAQPVTASSAGWGVLAIGALLLHIPWVVYREIATGSPAIPRSEANAEIRLFVIRCVVICVTYALMWALTRRESPRSVAR
jgi:hypothetical protein